MRTADRTAATVRSAACPIAGRPAARATWGRCLLARAPDLSFSKTVACMKPDVSPVRGLELPLLSLPAFDEKGMTREKVGRNGKFWAKPTALREAWRRRSDKSARCGAVIGTKSIL